MGSDLLWICYRETGLRTWNKTISSSKNNPLMLSIYQHFICCLIIMLKGGFPSSHLPFYWCNLHVYRHVVYIVNHFYNVHLSQFYDRHETYLYWKVFILPLVVILKLIKDSNSRTHTHYSMPLTRQATGGDPNLWMIWKLFAYHFHFFFFFESFPPLFVCIYFPVS